MGEATEIAFIDLRISYMYVYVYTKSLQMDEIIYLEMEK